ncbi:hypothetical protein YC2023_094166 [Brassica napus]
MMDVELGRKVDSVDESPLLEIKEHLDSPHPAFERQNQFGIYQIDDDTLSELEQQIDFVDRQTLENNTIEINNTEKHVVVEEADENRSRPIILDDPNTESEIPRELRKRPSTLRRKKENLEKMSKLIDKKERTSIDKPR